MNDAEYTLQQTNRERKTIARNAKYKRNGSRSKKCTLPSDYLTPAQKRRRNGPVQTYDLYKPHTLRELKLWPEDLRHIYMDELLNKYNPSNRDLALMLNCGPTNLHGTLPTHFGITRGRGGAHQTAEQALAWSRFINEEEPMLTLAPEEPKVVVPEATPEPEPVPYPEPVRPRFTYDEVSLRFTGKAEDILSVVASGALRINTTDLYEFTVTAVRKGA